MAGMMTSLLLLLLAGVTVGRVVDLQKRIYGGTDCTATERKYHVKLIRSDGTGRLVCGGSLMNDKWILTAAHCVRDKSKVRAVLRVHPGDNKKTFEIEDVVIYDAGTGKQDIALLKVNNPEKGFEAVTLPQCGTPPVEVQIAGHTLTTTDGDNNKISTESTNLLCAKINVAKCAVRICLSGYIYEHIFCYQGTGVDAGKGDSGGGVMVNDMIYGVHVSSDEEACVDARAMDVCKYMPWITGVIKP